MITQYIYLEKYDWYIIVFYIIDVINKAKIIDTLYSIDCDPLIIEGVEYNIDNNIENSGFAVTNNKIKTSVMMIGPTISAAEFQDTYDHEKGHVATHIATAMDIDPYGEGMQYLNGAIGKEMFPVAKYFLCDSCREKLYEE